MIFATAHTVFGLDKGGSLAGTSERQAPCGGETGSTPASIFEIPAGTATERLPPSPSAIAVALFPIQDSG